MDRNECSLWSLFHPDCNLMGTAGQERSNEESAVSPLSKGIDNSLSPQAEQIKKKKVVTVLLQSSSNAFCNGHFLPVLFLGEADSQGFDWKTCAINICLNFTVAKPAFLLAEWEPWAQRHILLSIHLSACVFLQTDPALCLCLVPQNKDNPG